MSGFEQRGVDGSSSSPSSSRTPRLAFPTTRSRPTSIVDTTASVEASTEAILSTSPASSVTSMGASPRKHTQSAADRLATAQARDAAAAAKSHRNRTTSSTSRSSTESTRTKLPSLLQATTAKSAATPATSTSLEISPSSKLEQEPLRPGPSSHAETGSTSDAIGAVDVSSSSMVRHGSRDQASTVNVKVAGPSTVKKSNATPRRTPNAPPLVALLSDSKASKLIKQGAEAKVYISRIVTNNILSWPQPRSEALSSSKVDPPASILLKWRFPKTYRHPTLSRNITASRTIMEARALLRCAKAGVSVPAVRCVDEKEGILGLELIAGKSVREWLGGGAEGEDELVVEGVEVAAAEEDEIVLSELDQVKLMRLIGRQLAIMHEADIIHGDLTTSNMMLRPASPCASSGGPVVNLEHDEVVLIDFGLSSVSAFAEDKAVDLYVLERAFASTHPASEALFQTILDSYAEEVTARSSGKNRSKGGKLDKWEETRRKLEEVRLRGRKRSMVGSALWKDSWNRRVVVIVELSIRFECHGLFAAIRSMPSLAGMLLRLRPTDALRLLGASRSGVGGNKGDEWHALASRMDTELDHIGSARLLTSHIPHESCVRTPPTEARPFWCLSLMSWQSKTLSESSLGRRLESVADVAMTRALQTVDRFVPFASASQRLGLRKKCKTD